MPVLNGKTLFFTTSPRTPAKMVPEISLLAELFSGKPWDERTQANFTYAMITSDFYQGSQEVKDPALTARDRINRGPKAYGFVDLKPVVRLTEAGTSLLLANHKEEPLLRQLIKFQLPSPFHTEPTGGSTRFWVKPYLELLRLVRYFGSLSFDEMMLFGMQLTDYRRFEEIVAKIEAFRRERASSGDGYRRLLNRACDREIRAIYAEELESGNLHTRESRTETPASFVEKKRRNLRDYADACFRYLRATGVVVVSQSAHSLSIASEKLDEVDFLLETVCRDPVYVDDEEAYKTYLYDSEQPKLYSDETDNVIRIIGRIDPSVDCSRYKPLELKDLLYDLLDREKQRFLDAESRRIKNYEEYDSIVETYEDIRSNKTGVGRYYDAPLMFEWNTWRAMTMIDGGEVSANLGFDDAGRPMHVAMGNMPDIVCDYDSFVLNVEVTLQSGQRQYDNEGEPVARHVGTMRRSTGKPVYCFFIARKIHPATLAHFYVLLRTEVEHYGGKALIVPLELTVFEKMLADSRKAAYVPRSEQILSFVEKARGAGEAAENENDWFAQVRDLALNWLSDA